jgi:hypothetical protein
VTRLMSLAAARGVKRFPTRVAPSSESGTERGTVLQGSRAWMLVVYHGASIAPMKEELDANHTILGRLFEKRVDLSIIFRYNRSTASHLTALMAATGRASTSGPETQHGAGTQSDRASIVNGQDGGDDRE